MKLGEIISDILSLPIGTLILGVLILAAILAYWYFVVSWTWTMHRENKKRRKP